MNGNSLTRIQEKSGGSLAIGTVVSRGSHDGIT